VVDGQLYVAVHVSRSANGALLMQFCLLATRLPVDAPIVFDPLQVLGGLFWLLFLQEDGPFRPWYYHKGFSETLVLLSQGSPVVGQFELF
jgi:hypothetical protein